MKRYKFIDFGGNEMKVEELSNIYNSEDVIEIVKEVASRLKDCERVLKYAKEDNNSVYIEGKKHSLWSDITLSHGYPGICILFGELSEHFSDEGWDKVAHEYMIKMNQSLAVEGIQSISLFGGAAGIGMAGFALSQNKTRYKNFLSQMNLLIIRALNPYIDTLDKNQISMSDYDVIKGVCGIGRYLLFFKDDKCIENTLIKILRYLIDITKDIEVKEHKVPGWYISADNQFLEVEKKSYPNGNFNCGLAHGIPGPMALLAIALINDVEISGQREAIKKIAEWLYKWKYSDSLGISWPGRISFEEYINNDYVNIATRAGWCYGAPGVLRSMWLAGEALEDSKYKNAAINALDRLFNENSEKWELFSPTFCHGYSGLLRITQLMYESTYIERFEKYRDIVLKKVLSYYEPDSPFGFYNVDNINPLEQGKLTKMNNPGMLDGISGTVLSLLSVARPVKTSWDSVFLLN